ncbi:MAG: hypothetical protein D4R39_00920 [Methylophilaceae bacterium]|nr:MAG: hypothetical protein D4R39_00920 [Methylophilaceae bacterium]
MDYGKRGIEMNDAEHYFQEGKVVNISPVRGRKSTLDLMILRAKLSRYMRSATDVCIGQMFQLSEPKANFSAEFIDKMRRACNEGCVIVISITPRDSTTEIIRLATSFERDE